MLEADGNDPNLPLLSGPTTGPASLGGVPRSVSHRGDRRRGSKPHGSMPRGGGTATDASHNYPHPRTQMVGAPACTAANSSHSGVSGILRSY